MLGTKAKFRNTVKERKSHYNAAELETLSVPPLFGIETDAAFNKAEKVAIYWSLPDEVHTHQFIEKWQSKKEFYLPVTKDDILHFVKFQGVSEMETGPFNVFEPSNKDTIKPEEIDVLVVPGLAFDENGHRLGRGKGFYDKYLSLTNAKKIGIAFPFQMFENVPTEKHDIVLDEVYY